MVEICRNVSEYSDHRDCKTECDVVYGDDDLASQRSDDGDGRDEMMMTTTRKTKQ